MLRSRLRLTVEDQGRIEDQGRGPAPPGRRARRRRPPPTAHRWFGSGRRATDSLARRWRPGDSPRPGARESRCLCYGIYPEGAWRELEFFYHGERPRVNPEPPAPRSSKNLTRLPASHYGKCAQNKVDLMHIPESLERR